MSITPSSPGILTWRLEKKNLPLRFLWKIARGSLETKEVFFLTVSDGTFSGMGEVSPNTRYGNTPAIIERDFGRLKEASTQEPGLSKMQLGSYGRWLDHLSLCQTVRFGAESAWVHLQSGRAGKPVSEYLGLSAVEEVATCFSVPIMDPGKIQDYLAPLARFRSIKIKVDAQTGTETIREVSKHTQQCLRIDGNETWEDPDEFMRFVESLRGKNIDFIEQPMPASMEAAYGEILPLIPWPLIADESITDHADFASLQRQFSGVNIKLMKTGGYVRAIELLKEARARGMKTMLGCMVETSLGISSAMHLASLIDYADLDGFLLLKEDPFGLVEENGGLLRLTHNTVRKPA
ncbi:MAG: hypothetical protein A2X94_10655 [Bdellovibrionales bacterium GWB1_55_8]|nr:MAG: hypothetical protein A2X94_10655 [Bdellovibrionales bacterium GWB1_55_8]